MNYTSSEDLSLVQAYLDVTGGEIFGTPTKKVENFHERLCAAYAARLGLPTCPSAPTSSNDPSIDSSSHHMALGDIPIPITSVPGSPSPAIPTGKMSVSSSSNGQRKGASLYKRFKRVLQICEFYAKALREAKESLALELDSVDMIDDAMIEMRAQEIFRNLNQTNKSFQLYEVFNLLKAGLKVDKTFSLKTASELNYIKLEPQASNSSMEVASPTLPLMLPTVAAGKETSSAEIRATSVLVNDNNSQNKKKRSAERAEIDLAHANESKARILTKISNGETDGIEESRDVNDSSTERERSIGRRLEILVGAYTAMHKHSKMFSSDEEIVQEMHSAMKRQMKIILQLQNDFNAFI